MIKEMLGTSAPPCPDVISDYLFDVTLCATMGFKKTERRVSGLHPARCASCVFETSVMIIMIIIAITVYNMY